MGMESWLQCPVSSVFPVQKQATSPKCVAWKAITQTCFLCMLLYCFLLWHVCQPESRAVMLLFPGSMWKEIDSFQIKLFNSSEIITALAHWWFSSVSRTDKARLSSAPYPVLLKRERCCTSTQARGFYALTPEILESLVTSGGNWKDHKTFVMTAK